MEKEPNEIDLDNYCHEPSLPKGSDEREMVTEDFDILNRLFA